MTHIKTGFTPKYKVIEIRGTNDQKWKHLKECFPTNQADKMNLLMGSTDGIHGSSTTLDELESAPTKERTHDEAFTILIIQPRICRLQCGTIGIRNEDDMIWLRTLITQSIEVFAKSQEGNTL